MTDIEELIARSSLGTPEAVALRLSFDAGNRMLHELIEMRDRLLRVAGLHVDDNGVCAECGHRSPCDTRRIVDGTFEEGD